MGWPVGHSLSPRLHGHWFERYGIDGAYVPLPVAAGGSRARLPGAAAAGLSRLERHGAAQGGGLPPGRRAGPGGGADRRREHRAGARGRPHARAQHRRAGLRRQSARAGARTGGPRPGRPCCSAPAVARAASAAALLDAGVPTLRLANRTPGAGGGPGRRADRARRRSRRCPGPSAATRWPRRRLLVNCTSLGMAGQPPLELSLDRAAARGRRRRSGLRAAGDTACWPRRARAATSAVDGLGMLLHQAVPGFAHWGGVVPEVDERLRAAVLAGG